MKKKLLNSLVCPKCHSELTQNKQSLACANCRLAFPIRDDIPVMLIEEAEKLEEV